MENTPRLVPASASLNTTLLQTADEMSRFLTILHKLSSDCHRAIDHSSKLIDESLKVIRACPPASGIMCPELYRVSDASSADGESPAPVTAAESLAKSFTAPGLSEKRHDGLSVAGATSDALLSHPEAAQGFATVDVLVEQNTVSDRCLEAMLQFIMEVAGYYQASNVHVSGGSVLTQQMVVFALPHFPEAEIEACLEMLQTSGLIQVTEQHPLQFSPKGLLAGWQPIDTNF